MKTIWITLAVMLVVVAVLLALSPRASDKDEETSDYEELAPCAFLTSLDSKRSLYLSPSHVARLSEGGGVAMQWQTGRWQLLDDEKRTFKIRLGGTDTVYTLVSAPEGEGCMLVPGDTSSADLSKSWFSTLQDPK